MTTIDASHISLINDKIDEALSFAANDEEALAILEELERKTLAGMTWDEKGQEYNIVKSDEASAYWTEDQIAAESGNFVDEEEEDNTVTYIILGVLGLIVLWLFFQIFFADSSSDVAELDLPEGEVPAEAADSSLLSLSDDLGKRIDLDQPATLEIIKIAGGGFTLPVINTPIKDREIQILDELIEGEPVAQWVFGTTINKVFGISPQIINSVDVGDRLLIRTQTGDIDEFLCREVRNVAAQQAEVFVQQRPGVTLFALPAPTNPVRTLWCPYLPENETVATSRTLNMNQWGAVNNNIELLMESVTAEQTLGGQVNFTVQGKIRTKQESEAVIMALLAQNGRYSPDGDQYIGTTNEETWLAHFNQLPTDLLGRNLQIEINSIFGESLIFNLTPVDEPAFRVTLDQSKWDSKNEAIELQITLTNEADISGRISPDMFTATQGGNNLFIDIDQKLPLITPPGSPWLATINIIPESISEPIYLRINNTQWEITGFPIVN